MLIEKEKKQKNIKNANEKIVDHALFSINIHSFIRTYIINESDNNISIINKSYWTKERGDYFVNKYVAQLKRTKFPKIPLTSLTQQEIVKVIKFFKTINPEISSKLIMLLKQNKLIENIDTSNLEFSK